MTGYKTRLGRGSPAARTRARGAAGLGLAMAALVASGGGGERNANAYFNPIPTATNQQGPNYIALQPPFFCNPPSATTCASQVWVRYCGGYWNATDPNDSNNPCWEWQGPAATAYWGTQPLTESVYDPSVDDFSLSLPPPDKLPKPTDHDGTQNTWATREDNTRWAALNQWIPDPRSWTRPIGATQAGLPMYTCENYVYRSFYDVERWLDAVYACQGDTRCIVNLSLWGMTSTGPSKSPGIARREMLDSEGHAISDRLYQLRQQGKMRTWEADPFSTDYSIGELPKNAFYAATRFLISQSLINAFAADDPFKGQQAQALLNELARGQDLYQMNNPPVYGGKVYLDAQGRAHRGFYDEWDFHNYMNKRTQGATEGQFREFRRRSNNVLSQYDLVVDEVKCLIALPGQCNSRIPNALGKVNPGDTQLWQSDPFASRSILGSISPEAFLTPPALQGQVGFGSRLSTSLYSLNDLLTATDLTSGTQLLTDGMHLPGLTTGGAVGGAQTLSYTGTIDSTSSSRSGGCTDWSGTGCGGPIIRGLPVGPTIDGPAPAFDATTGTSIFNMIGFVNRLWEVNPPRIDHSSPFPKLDCRVPVRGRDGGGIVGDAVGDFGGALVSDTQMRTNEVWRDVCVLTNQLLEEWARAQEGKGSCLDTNNFACDWQPQDFIDRFVTKNVGYGAAAKEVEYKYCKRWTGGNQLWNEANPAVGLPVADRSDLPTLRGKLDDREAVFNQKFKTIPIQGDDDFGTARADSQHLGDKKFGGGYDYYLGWHLKTYERKNGQICRMGGNATASFTADARLFSHKFSIVDAYGTVSSNDGDTGKAYLNSHLYVVDYEIFDTKDADGAASNGDLSLTNSYSDTKKDGDHIELLEVPFQVAWVTITVSAGISYDYGITYNLSFDAPQPHVCDVANPLLSAKAVFTPFADLGVWVDADASLAGIVGVGVEVDLTLVGIQLPLTAKLSLNFDNLHNLTLNFNCTLDLVLTTLKGELDFYIKAFFLKVASFKIVSWDGFQHKFPIFRTPPVSLLLSQLPAGSVFPPGHTAASDTY